MYREGVIAFFGDTVNVVCIGSRDRRVRRVIGVEVECVGMEGA